MKQYTTPEQTTKLIELGFDRPKFEIETQLCNIKGQPLRAATIVGDYSIGELIEILPKLSSKRIRYVATKRAWVVDVDVLGKSGCAKCYRGAYHAEFVDALYDMLVKLKEEGVI